MRKPHFQHLCRPTSQGARADRKLIRYSKCNRLIDVSHKVSDNHNNPVVNTKTRIYLTGS